MENPVLFPACEGLICGQSMFMAKLEKALSTALWCKVAMKGAEGHHSP